MRIIVDVMGSDLGPAPIIKGAIVAKEEFGNNLTFVGDEDVIRKAAESCNLSLDGVKIVHASDVIRMTDDPMSVRSKTDSSMRVALRLLAEGEGDALVSCGNTGALQTGATLFVKRIKGIHRAAIGAILPMEKPLLVLDSGANLTVTPEYLVQFAVMGSVYMEKLFDLNRARVGLLNIGTEEKKGNPLQVDSYQLLKNSNIHFVGNIEGKDIPFNKCDLVVTDGFTGNVLLKVVEGMGGYMIKLLKELFYANTKTKLGALLVKKQLGGMKKKMDARTYGGAPILGISKPVIKAHGNSDAIAIRNAIRQAIRFVEYDVNDEIINRLSEFSAAAEESVSTEKGL